jgi:hypothetical protein
MMRILITVFLLIFLAGCGKPESFEPRSHLSRDQAETLARAAAIMVGGKFAHMDGKSDSMGDHISQNSFVVYAPAWEAIEDDFLISFAAGDALVLHRAVHESQGWWKTSGTANRRSDPGWINESEYRGTLIAQFYHK